MEMILVQLASVVISGVLSYGAYYLKQTLDIQVSEARRKALHTALINGLRLGLRKQLTGKDLLGVAVEYARTFSPQSTMEAEKHFDSRTRSIEDIAEALIPDALEKLIKVEGKTETR